MINANLTSNLTEIAVNATPIARRAALLQTAADIVSVAKQLVPVDTGALKQSLGAEPQSSTEIWIGSDKVYAPVVEYGRLDMPNYPIQPYLTPAMAQSEATFRKRLEDELAKLS